jgi:hypothetical protein
MESGEEDGVPGATVQVGEARRGEEIDEVADPHGGVRVGTLAAPARITRRDRLPKRLPPRELAGGDCSRPASQTAAGRAGHVVVVSLVVGLVVLIILVAGLVGLVALSFLVALLSLAQLVALFTWQRAARDELAERTS